MPAPIVAAAGITAAAGLLNHFMQQRAAEKAAQEAREAEERAAKRSALQQAQQNQLSAIGNMGEREGSAINNLIAALQRTAR